MCGTGEPALATAGEFLPGSFGGLSAPSPLGNAALLSIMFGSMVRFMVLYSCNEKNK
jgi:hypothetical protein